MPDRVVRVVFGMLLILVCALDLAAAPWSYLVVLIGIIALATGVSGTCARYSLPGTSTRGKKA